MKKHSLLIGMMISFTALTTLAAVDSNGREHPKKWQAAWDECSSRNYLDCAYTMAQNHKKIFERELSQLVQKNDGNLTCQIDEVNYELSYDEWMITHYEQLKKIEADYTAQMNAVTTKLGLLKTTTVDLTPVEHQTSENVSVGYENLLTFFRGVNQRMASCPDNRMSTLKAQLENSRLNTPQITLSQFKTALTLMANKLNASLKAQATDYEFVINTESNPIEFKLKISTLNEGVKNDFMIDLLANHSKSLVDLNEDSKWEYLSKMKLHENGQDYPLGGFARRDLMQTLLRSQECDRWTSSPAEGARYPYVSSEGLKRMAMSELPGAPPKDCKAAAHKIIDWGDRDAQYVCTARGAIALDAFPLYNKCVINELKSGQLNGEDIINHCMTEHNKGK